MQQAIIQFHPPHAWKGQPQSAFCFSAGKKKKAEGKKRQLLRLLLNFTGMGCTVYGEHSKPSVLNLEVMWAEFQEILKVFFFKDIFSGTQRIKTFYGFCFL